LTFGLFSKKNRNIDFHDKIHKTLLLKCYFKILFKLCLNNLKLILQYTFDELFKVFIILPKDMNHFLNLSWSKVLALFWPCFGLIRALFWPYFVFLGLLSSIGPPLAFTSLMLNMAFFKLHISKFSFNALSFQTNSLKHWKKEYKGTSSATNETFGNTIFYEKNGFFYKALLKAFVMRVIFYLHL